MIFSVFSTVGIIPLGICSDAVSEDTDWIISISQDLILPLMIRTKSHSLLQILLERYAYSEIGGTFILI